MSSLAFCALLLAPILICLLQYIATSQAPIKPTAERDDEGWWQWPTRPPAS